MRGEGRMGGDWEGDGCGRPTCIESSCLQRESAEVTGVVRILFQGPCSQVPTDMPGVNGLF